MDRLFRRNLLRAVKKEGQVEKGGQVVLRRPQEEIPWRRNDHEVRLEEKRIGPWR